MTLCELEHIIRAAGGSVTLTKSWRDFRAQSECNWR
jgi:hypothetical protein